MCLEADKMLLPLWIFSQYKHQQAILKLLKPAHGSIFYSIGVTESGSSSHGYHVTLMINPDHRNLSICNPVYIQNSFHYPSINPETVSIQFQ